MLRVYIQWVFAVGWLSKSTTLIHIRKRISLAGMYICIRHTSCAKNECRLHALSSCVVLVRRCCASLHTFDEPAVLLVFRSLFELFHPLNVCRVERNIAGRERENVWGENNTKKLKHALNLLFHKKVYCFCHALSFLIQYFYTLFSLSLSLYISLLFHFVASVRASAILRVGARQSYFIYMPSI